MSGVGGQEGLGRLTSFEYSRREQAPESSWLCTQIENVPVCHNKNKLLKGFSVELHLLIQQKKKSLCNMTGWMKFYFDCLQLQKWNFQGHKHECCDVLVAESMKQREFKYLCSLRLAPTAALKTSLLLTQRTVVCFNLNHINFLLQQSEL